VRFGPRGTRYARVTRPLSLPARRFAVRRLEAIKRTVCVGLGPALLPAASLAPAPHGTVARELADAALGLPGGGADGVRALLARHRPFRQ